jgi:site-specific DNA-methyltransferase (adenine-specific)
VSVELHLGDCLDVMRGMPDGCVDAVVCDPPYGIAFMGKDWDDFGRQRPRKNRGGYNNAGILPGYGRGGTPEQRDLFARRSSAAFQLWATEWAAEALRVAKPGAHILAFGGTRTFHRLACAIEDAGWQIKDCLSWLYGSGFPKHKTLLKPAWEPVVMAAKAGARVVNVDACRIAYETTQNPATNPLYRARNGYKNLHGSTPGIAFVGHPDGEERNVSSLGRWPANVCLDEAAAAVLDAQSGQSVSRLGTPRASSAPGNGYGMTHTGAEYSDSGGASRFFYCAKASRSEREAGLDCHEIVSVCCDSWEEEGRQVQLRVDTAVFPPRVTAASTTRESDATAWSTFLFGSPTTGLFRLDTKSIIATMTSSTTESRTLSLLLRSLTSAGIAVVSGEGPSGGSLAGGAGNSIPSLTITSEKSGYTLGVGPVPLATRLTISASAERVASHPTVKPVALMRWLVRLVTPPDGVALDPFMGSGTTGVACVREDRSFIGIEREPEYHAIAAARIAHARGETPVDAEQPALPFEVSA